MSWRGVPDPAWCRGCSSLTQLSRPWGGWAGAREHFTAEGQRYEPLGCRVSWMSREGRWFWSHWPHSCGESVRMPKGSILCPPHWFHSGLRTWWFIFSGPSKGRLRPSSFFQMSCPCTGEAPKAYCSRGNPELLVCEEPKPGRGWCSGENESWRWNLKAVWGQIRWMQLDGHLHGVVS